MCEARLQASPRRVRKPRSGWRDLQVCEARLQASPRGVRKPRSGWRVKKKQSLTACGGAPFTQGSLKTSRQPKFLLPTFLFKEKYGAYFSFQRKVRSKKVRCVYINRYKKGREGDCGWRIGAAHSAKQKVSVQTPSLCPKIY